MKNKNLWLISGLLLVLALAFTACSNPTSGTSVKVNAQVPVITTQPGDIYAYVDDVFESLAVEASVGDGGVLSYQWYSNTTKSTDSATQIEGAIDSNFAPPNDVEGTEYYYVVITNTNSDVKGSKTASVTSSIARVTLDDPDNAQTPNITIQPAGASYFVGDVITPLTITAAPLTDGGVLSYRWYKTDTVEDTGTQIAGAAGSGTSYTPANNPAGTEYYYVVVTNTNSGKIGVKVTTNKSDVVGISLSTPAAAATPVITQQPIGKATFLGSSETLSVTATKNDNGILSYQWYSNTSQSATNGSVIPGATDASFAPTLTEVGTYYYYVVVTNTNTWALQPVSVVTSNAVTLTIIAGSFDDITPNITLTVDDSIHYQYVRGYGGMSNVEFRAGNGSPSPDMSVSDITAMFDPAPLVVDSQGRRVSGGLGLNVLRICLYDDLDGIVSNAVQGASSTLPPRDNSDYYDIVKEVNRLGGYAYACPWTFPVDFKTPAGSTLIGTSGSINTARWPELADYFKTYLEKMNAQGAPIFGVSIQNEPNVSVGYEGCRWTGTNDQRDFIRVLGPALEGIPGYGGGQATSKVWIGSGEDSGAPDASNTAVVTDTGVDGASQWSEYIPRHFYGAMQTRYATGLEAGKEVWETEHADTTSRPGAGDAMYNTMGGWNWVWHIANEVYCSTGLNDESVYLFWYAKRFYGYLGDGQYGTTESSITGRGYMMSQFAKYAANTNRVAVTAAGSYVENQGITAGSSGAALGDTSLPVVQGINFNPTTFDNGNNDTAGQNVPIAKVLAFESVDGNSVVVIAYTPTRNSGEGGQNMGDVKINLPSGFKASGAELMRSNATVKHQMESVLLNSDGSSAIINVPRSNIVSVKFTR